MRRLLIRAACVLTAAVTLAGVVVAGSAGGPAVAGVRAARALSVAGGRPAPFGRVWPSWVYDPARHYVLLFGGDTDRGGGTGGIALGTTWTWNGRWTERHPAAAPSVRTGAAVVFDSATGQLLLFGGSTRPGTEGGFLGDTWVWTGRTWTRLHPAVSPPARHNADMIYDPADREVILFGGYDGAYLGDTWAWNGTTWTQLHPANSPSPRDTESLVYDPATRTAVMYGGFSDSTGRLADTWSWNGTTWTQLHPASSPGVVSPVWQSAYDPAARQLIVYGGDLDGSYSQDTWAWTGRTWTLLQPAANPGPRSYGAMTYDPALHRVLLIDGADHITDPRGIWEWNGSTWTIQ